ncbi:MAG: FAD-dependent oxidoreductase [Bacteroidales bacterium]|nr:FAD-dependent oxidoreductase [Bacteroidales bacterium]
MRKHICLAIIVGLALLTSCHSSVKNGTDYEADVIIYGGSSAAIMAAVQVKKMGQSVIVVSPDKHIGGLSSSGLGFTDVGRKEVIGGLSREFYHKVYQHYADSASWKWGRPSDVVNDVQGHTAIDDAQQTMWIFEPHVAENIFESYITENDIEVLRDEWLNRETGVVKENGKIVSIKTLSGKTFKGKVFIDATYEGDLMAAAGVSYHVGREANSAYKENWNGVQTGVHHHLHYLEQNVSAYVIPGKPSSGLLPRISSEDPGKYGEGDHKIQAYCYRMCLSHVRENQRPFEKPEGYDSTQYEILVRMYQAGFDQTRNATNFSGIPNKKTDSNNAGPFSTDNIGMNYEYPEASYERRKEILKEHETYQRGLLYFVSVSKRIPDKVRNEMKEYGLAKDEFKDNGNWPYQIYVREARRMVADYVVTENEVMSRNLVPESIGMGSYAMDSHNVQRFVTKEGYVQNEGDVGVGPEIPYMISYKALTPKKAECNNLLVSVCVSCSHIAYGSIRMEPVFMIIGQSAGAAAAMAAKQNIAVQDLKYGELKENLLKFGQRLDNKAKY